MTDDLAVAYAKEAYARLRRVERERTYIASALEAGPLYLSRCQEGINVREMSGVIVYRQEDGHMFEVTVRELYSPTPRIDR